MKIFILGILLAFHAGAVTLEKYRSSGEGVASQKFTLNEKDPTYQKTSNYFDIKAKDYSVGIYKLKTETPEYKEIAKKLDEFAKKLKTADDFLKSKGSSFNEVSGAVKHEPVFYLNEYQIKQDSEFFAELDGHFKALQKMDWNLSRGHRISEDLEKVMDIENGQTVKTSRYARDLFCQKVRPPMMCKFSGGGHVYVE